MDETVETTEVPAPDATDAPGEFPTPDGDRLGDDRERAGEDDGEEKYDGGEIPQVDAPVEDVPAEDAPPLEVPAETDEPAAEEAGV